MLNKYGMLCIVVLAALAVGVLMLNNEASERLGQGEAKQTHDSETKVEINQYFSSEVSAALLAISPNDNRAVMSSRDGQMLVVEPTSVIKLNENNFSVVQFSIDKLVLKNEFDNDLYLFHKAVDGVSFLQRVSGTAPVNTYDEMFPVKSNTLTN